jgi:prepilin-type N-terminal cleavage/methylation domain-containing protein
MKRDARFGAQAGLSLPELLVVSAILVTLLGLLHTTFTYQSQMQRRETAKNVTQTDLRVWVERMVRDIRVAGYDPRETNATTPTFTILALSPTEVRFTTDFDGDGTLDSNAQENLGYRLNGDALELWRGGSSWRPVLEGVSNLTLTCFDAQNDTRTCDADDQSLRRSVSAISIALTAEAETGGVPTMAPPVLTQKATAELRNEIY